jgi:hypothetical protein
MLTVVCSSKGELIEFEEYIIKTSGLRDKIQFLGYTNGGKHALTEIYNIGLNEAIYDKIVFLHDDILIDTNRWGEKLLKLFDKNPEYGIIGVAGTKYMSNSGMWWENRNKMYGKVSHTHEGKTWLTSYSDDLGQIVEETVVVDGVFFAIDKTKIKKNFNEDFKGFHFYDVSFCFDNYLAGVKIGVSTLIRINHKSIGMTNEQWEQNRVQFAETYKENLPVSITKKLRKGERLKIMLTSLMFDDESVKSNIVLDLAKKLKKDGHDITICSNMKGKMPNIAKQVGINLAPIQQPPGFLLGDGKWALKTQNGDTPSKENTLYKVKDYNFSVIHAFDDEVVDHMMKLYNQTPIFKETNFEDNIIEKYLEII